MLLRHHPLVSYHGLRSWPPVWTYVYGGENKRPRGEIGFLREIVPSSIQPADRCFLYVDHEGSTYIGCLLIADPAFCNQVVKLLQGYINRPIAEIVPSSIQPADRCFLYVDHEGSTYIGCLLIDDPAFCNQMVKLLQGCVNRPIAEIGSLDLSHTF